MNRLRCIVAIIRYTWLAAWCRAVIVTAPGLILLILLAQLPRILSLRAAFVRDDRGALSEYVAFVGSFHANLVLTGAFLALALGASTTSRRHMTSSILQIAARPVRRGEILAARSVGHGLVLVSFWLAPVTILELLRRSFDAPLGVPAGAWVAPLLGHGFLLVLGALLGTRLSPLPATLAGSLVSWILISLGDGSITSISGESIARLCDLLVPPLDDIFAGAASPFAGSQRPLFVGLTSVRMIAWIGIASLLAERCFARLDLTSRPH